MTPPESVEEDLGPYFIDPEKVPIGHRVEITLEGNIKRYMHDGEDDNDITEKSQVFHIGGSAMLVCCTTLKQFELMDELVKVASKVQNMDYIISKIKSIPT